MKPFDSWVMQPVTENKVVAVEEKLCNVCGGVLDESDCICTRCAEPVCTGCLVSVGAPYMVEENICTICNDFMGE